MCFVKAPRHLACVCVCVYGRADVESGTWQARLQAAPAGIHRAHVRHRRGLAPAFRLRCRGLHRLRQRLRRAVHFPRPPGAGPGGHVAPPPHCRCRVSRRHAIRPSPRAWRRGCLRPPGGRWHADDRACSVGDHIGGASPAARRRRRCGRWGWGCPDGGPSDQSPRGSAAAPSRHARASCGKGPRDGFRVACSSSSSSSLGRKLGRKLGGG